MGLRPKQKLSWNIKETKWHLLPFGAKQHLKDVATLWQHLCSQIARAKKSADVTEKYCCNGTWIPFWLLPYLHVILSEHLLSQHPLRRIYCFFVVLRQAQVFLWSYHEEVTSGLNGWYCSLLQKPHVILIGMKLPKLTMLQTSWYSA